MNTFDAFIYILSKKNINDQEEQFKKFIIYYLSSKDEYKQYLELNEIPYTILNELNIKKNIKIDGILITKDNKYISVQIQFKSNINEFIDYKDLETGKKINNFYKNIVLTNIFIPFKNLNNLNFISYNDLNKLSKKFILGFYKKKKLIKINL